MAAPNRNPHPMSSAHLFLEPETQQKAPAGHPAEEPSQGKKLDQLPPEMLIEILARVPFHPKTFLNLKLVCQLFHNIIDPRTSIILMDRIASYSYPVVYTAYPDEPPNFVTLQALRRRHDAAQIITNHIKKYKTGQPDDWEDRVYKGLIIWDKFETNCEELRLPVIERDHMYQSLLCDNTKILMRYVCIHLGYLLWCILNEETAMPVVRRHGRIETYHGRDNHPTTLAAAYDIIRPSLKSIINGLRGANLLITDPDIDPEDIEDDDVGAYFDFNLLEAVRPLIRRFTLYHHPQKPWPDDVSFDDWLRQPTGFDVQVGTSSFHRHHLDTQLFIHAMLKADGLTGEVEALRFLASRQRNAMNGVYPGDVQLVIDLADGDEELPRELVTRAFMRCDVDATIETEVMSGDWFEPVDELFERAIEELEEMEEM